MGEIGYGPLERIDGPLPLPPLYGLLPAAEAPAAGVRIVIDTDVGPQDVNDLSSTGESMQEVIARLKEAGSLPPSAGNSQERWLNGVEVYPYPTDTGSIFDACAPSTETDGTKSFGEDMTNPQFAAITVYVSETCKSYRVWDQARFKARAVAALTAVESSLLGRHFMTGEGSPLSPHLADDAPTCQYPNGDTVTNALNGLALLEQTIAETGRLGLVHGSPQFATAIRERFAVDNRTGVIRTVNGIPVIPDFGYARGSTPHGHAAATGTQEWIYATGPIDIRRSEIFVLPDDLDQALDRGATGGATTGRSNTITYRAERYYLVVWDTALQAAVLVDRCQSGC
jgi:hypothetical protein